MPERRLGRGRLLLGAAAVAAATALQLLRQSGQRSWDTMWAEDGSLYTTDAEFLPVFSTLFRGYAGYAQLLPRLLAVGTSLVEPQHVARYVALVSTASTAVLALLVYRWAGEWVRSLLLRFVLGVSTALAPLLYWENTANLANLSWVLLFAAFWAVVSLRDRWYDVVTRAVVVLLAITSSPLGFLLVPLSLGTTFFRRARADIAVLAALLVGGALQGFAMLATTYDRPPRVSDTADLPLVYGVRVMGSVLVGERPLDELWGRFDATLAVAAAVVILGVATAAFLRNRRPESRRLALVTGGYSLLFFLVTVGLRGTAAVRPLADQYDASGARYLVVPLLLLLSAVVVLVDGAPRPARLVLAGHAIAVTAVSLVMPNLRSAGPSWAGQVAAAREQCELPGTERVGLMVSPGVGWQVVFDCDRFGGP